jgi:protein TonB
MDSFDTISIEVQLPPRRRRLRRPTAAVGSIVIHLALVGGLWSAQIVHLNEFRLAGGRGSVELQASVAAPTPAETPIVERVLPTKVRVEPDHVHVDRQTIWTAPPVDPPTDEATEHDHLHEHPHRHEPHVHDRPPTAAALNVPVVPPSTAADASAATSIGHDETLPAPADNPPPRYPAEAHRAGIEGTVVLRVGVRSDGGVEFVEVAQSSGHRALDDAAVEAVRRWRFTPGRIDGRTAPFVLRLPIVFKL